MKNTDKIFLISFNKCATSTFHWFMHSNGVSSAHWVAKGNVNIAQTMMDNIKSKNDILYGLESYTAFSDLCFLDPPLHIEPYHLFEYLYKQYPESKYIFFDRPLEDWIRSRKDHGLLPRYKKIYNLKTDEDAFDNWREDYISHKSNVLSMLEGKSNFLYYDIMNDDVSKIIDFLPEHNLDATHWTKKNVTKDRINKLNS